MALILFVVVQTGLVFNNMSINIMAEGLLRKTEYLRDSLEFDRMLENALAGTNITGNIVGVSFDHKSLYGVYFLGMPKNTGLVLTDVNTQLEGNNLTQVKIQKPSNYIDMKVYLYNPADYDNFIDGHTIVGSSYFVKNPKKHTVYYIKDKLESEKLKDLAVVDYMSHLTNVGFFAKTFENGIESKESYYPPRNLP